MAIEHRRAGRLVLRLAQRPAGRLAATLCCAGACAAPARVCAQGATLVTAGRVADWADAAVGSEEENYMRLLQVAGVARPRPWSVRPFGPDELRGLVPDSAAHPWRARHHLGSAAPALRWTGAAAGGVYNSAAPLTYNDGAVWAGRGVTGYVRGGVAARWRWLSARAEPVAFWAANARFALVPNGRDGAERFGDALEPRAIDLPRRYGDRPYARLDPGQSTLRLDALGLSLGATTANQWWGPALVDAPVLGANAAGYPRLFAGTSRPLNVGVGTVHAVVQTGRLAQTAHSPMPADSAYRTGAAVAAVITIRGVRGLELGGTRFFHEEWEGLGHAVGRAGASVQRLYGFSGAAVRQNQLGSVFGRWVLAPVEVYGEYLRNDASADTRDLLVQPDHNSGYLVGFRHVRRSGAGDGRLVAFRVEHLNTRVTHLGQVRQQTRPYQHNEFRQGHTERGQALGSEAGHGGGATTVGVDLYRPDGRWTFELARRIVQSSVTAAAPSSGWNVRYLARAERLRFGTSADLFVGAAPVVELNRTFGRDAYGVRLDAGWRLGRVRRASRP